MFMLRNIDEYPKCPKCGRVLNVCVSGVESWYCPKCDKEYTIKDGVLVPFGRLF